MHMQSQNHVDPHELRKVFANAASTSAILVVAGMILLYLPVFSGTHSLYEAGPQFILWFIGLFGYSFGVKLASGIHDEGGKHTFRSVERYAFIWLALVEALIAAVSLVMWDLMAALSPACAYQLLGCGLAAMLCVYCGLSLQASRVATFLIMGFAIILAGASGEVGFHSPPLVGPTVNRILIWMSPAILLLMAGLVRRHARRGWRRINQAG